jgi:hypothetical protein
VPYIEANWRTGEPQRLYFQARARQPGTTLRCGNQLLCHKHQRKITACHRRVWQVLAGVPGWGRIGCLHAERAVARLSCQGKASTGFVPDDYAYLVRTRAIKTLHRAWRECLCVLGPLPLSDRGDRRSHWVGECHVGTACAQRGGGLNMEVSSFFWYDSRCYRISLSPSGRTHSGLLLY